MQVLTSTTSTSSTVVLLVVVVVRSSLVQARSEDEPGMTFVCKVSGRARVLETPLEVS